MEPTIYDDMSNEDYHKTDGLSKSGISLMLKSPAHYYARYMADGKQIEPTPAMILGTAVHTAVLEPDKFDKEYARAPDGINRRTKAGKEEYAAFQAENKGKEILKPADFDQIEEMRESVLSSNVASNLLRGGKAETSYFWQENDVTLKCRPDYIAPGGILVDLKTTVDAGPEAFSKSAYNFGYHIQAAHYMAGTGSEYFLFFCVEKTPPYAVAIYSLDRDAVELGALLARDAIERYKVCLQKNVWPGYSQNIRKLSLPPWAYR